MAFAAIASAAGNSGGMMGMAMLPFKIAAENAKRAEALYEKDMQKGAALLASTRALNDEQRSIVALEQNRILSNTAIDANQRRAAAQAKVQAAVAGVEGGTVDQVLFETEKNQALATADVDTQTEQGIAQSLENVDAVGYSLATQTMPEFKSDAQQKMFNAVFGQGPGLYGFMTGQGPSGGFGLFGKNWKGSVKSSLAFTDPISGTVLGAQKLRK